MNFLVVYKNKATIVTSNRSSSDSYMQVYHWAIEKYDGETFSIYTISDIPHVVLDSNIINTKDSISL